METQFVVGQRVRSTVTAQGMEEGETYLVVGTSCNRTPWGTYVTYTLQHPEGRHFQVGNGHLVLRSVR